VSNEHDFAEAERILRAADSILVVDWPSRDVPDSLARAGFTVVVHGGPGPEDYSVYEVIDDEVAVRHLGVAPEYADIVYSFRPIGELAGIVDMARTIGATAVWTQSGLAGAGVNDPAGCWMSSEDSQQARKIVESAGLTYVAEPYIADVARQLGGRK
jgi:predicted CoA-binding protein